MLRGVIGDSSFYRGVRTYLKTQSGSSGFAVTEDFKRIMENESGKDLTVFFDQWIYGEGYPNYHLTWTQNKNNWIKLNLNQTTTHSSVSFFKMPVRILLKSSINSKTITLDHTFSGQSFEIDAGFAVDSIIIDPNLQVLSKIKTSKKLTSVFQEEKIVLSPNPSSNGIFNLFVFNPSELQYNIRIFSSIGAELYKESIFSAGSDFSKTFSLEKYPKGIFLVQLSNSKGQLLLKKMIH